MENGTLAGNTCNTRSGTGSAEADFTSSFLNNTHQMEPSLKKLKFSKPFCSHCGVYVSKSTFYRHYRDFYDKSTDSWMRDLQSDKSAEFQFSSSSSSEESDATEEVSDKD